MIKRFVMASVTRALALVVMSFSGIALGVACGGEDDGDSSGSAGSGGGGGSPGAADGGDIYDQLGIDPPPEDTPDFTYSDVPAPYEDIDGCKAFSDTYPDERGCMCDNCFDLMQQCDALQGCQEMFECQLEQQCVDENDCYFGGKCTEIYDRWGNTGASTALSRLIGTCANENTCTSWAP
jgi:hypothetical protein